MAEVSETPQNRLAMVGNALSKVLPVVPEYLPGDRAIIFVSDETCSGITVHGYDDLDEAIVELFMHLRAMFQATGRDLDFIGIPDNLGDMK